MSAAVNYPISNVMRPMYHLWDAVWVVPTFQDGSLGFRDFTIESEFPWTRATHGNFEFNWKGGAQLTRLNRVFWWSSILASVMYLIFLFGGQRIMKDKKAMEFKGPLAIWNLVLAVFSFIGTFRLVPHLLYGLYINPHSYFFCRTADAAYGHIGAVALWTNLFVWSKFVELIDTAFLVVRKKPVSFLHWFHHATVLMYCWHAGQYHMPTGIFFATMNYVVHSIMYFYYFLAAVGKPPKWGKIVTILQIAQMLIGMFVTGYHYYLLQTVPNCDGSYENLFAAFVMYTAYMILFVQFFMSRYSESQHLSDSTRSKKKLQ